MFSVASRVIVQKTTYDNDGNVSTLVVIKSKALMEGQYFLCGKCRDIETICNDHEMQITKEEALNIFRGPEPNRIPGE